MKSFSEHVNESQQKTDVVANDTNKILDTFDANWAARGHYWVEKGWASMKPHKGQKKGDKYAE